MDPVQALDALDDDQKRRLAEWVALNQAVCESLGIDWEDWVVRYIGEAAKRGGDYGFLQATGTADVLRSAGLADYAVKQARTSVKPHGNLSTGLQDAVSAFLSGGQIEETKLAPSDVAALQRKLPAYKALVRLPRPKFRSVVVRTDGGELVIRSADDELVRLGQDEVARALTDAVL